MALQLKPKQKLIKIGEAVKIKDKQPTKARAVKPSKKPEPKKPKRSAKVKG